MPTVRAKKLAEQLLIEINRYMLETDEDYVPDRYVVDECAKDIIDELPTPDGLPKRDEPDYCVECRGIYSHRDDCSELKR